MNEVHTNDNATHAGVGTRARDDCASEPAGQPTVVFVLPSDKGHFLYTKHIASKSESTRSLSPLHFKIELNTDFSCLFLLASFSRRRAPERDLRDRGLRAGDGRGLRSRVRVLPPTDGCERRPFRPNDEEGDGSKKAFPLSSSSVRFSLQFSLFCALDEDEQVHLH